MTDFHLDEEARQGLADDKLSEARRADAAAHIARCQSCADDVSRLRSLVMHTRARLTGADAAPDDVEVDAIWPDIRARIESAKVVKLGDSLSAPARRGRPWTRRDAISVAVGLATAAIGVMLVVRRAPVRDTSAIPAPDGAPIVAADDSTTAYQREVGILLEQLELQRAMLQPNVAASIDRDLNAIDRAIAELRDALKHDPNNPALRQLLAASYRQKRDLLKRVGNAS